MKVRGSVIILEKEGKFLLQLRADSPKINHPNTWGLFGGNIEEGETPIEAIIREIKEELELELKEESIEKVNEFISEKRDIFIFKTTLEKNLSEIKLNEGQDMKLFSLEEIFKLENASPGLKELFENLHTSS